MSPKLEFTIHRLIDQRDAAVEGSAEYEHAAAELGKLFDQFGDDALLIAEEYQAQPSE
jgi:hypothetical protein